MKKYIRFAMMAWLALAASPMTAQELPPGLISRWQAEGDVLDSVGTNHGSVYVPPQHLNFVPGKSGEAFYFSDSIVSVADTLELQPTNVTVQCWVKGTNVASFRYIVAKSKSGGGISYALYTGSGSGALFFVNVVGVGTIFSGAVAPAAIWDGNWHQLTATYNGDTAHLYLDGIEVGVGGAGAGEIDYANPQPLIFGDYSLARGLPYNGALDEVKLFNRALSAADALETFTNPGSPVGLNGLVGWWKAEGNLLDSWGSNHGTQPQPARLFEFAEGKDGLAFLPKNGIATVPDSPSLQPASLTVQAWVKSVGPGSFRYIVTKPRTGGGISFALYTGSSGGLSFFVNTPGTILSPLVNPEAVWDGAWHLATATYDGSVVRIYVDGIEVGTGTAGGGAIDYSNPESLIFGDYQITGGLPYFGLIDDVQLYDRALTAAEILEYYTQNRLVSWWPATGNAEDSVGENEGSLVGAVSFGLGRLLNGQAFNTSGGLIEVADAASLRPANLTIEAEISSVTPGANKYVVSKSSTVDNAAYALFTGPDGGLAFYVTTENGRFTSPTMNSSVWNGEYHIVAGTYDGQHVRLFVDGNEIGSGTPATGAIVYGASHSGGKLLIGDFSDVVGAANFMGNIDEVRLFNVALSSEEIAQNAFRSIFYIDQPKGQVFVPGSTVTLTVRAQGPAGVTYQWLANGTNLPGATNATLVLTNIQANQAGEYRVLASCRSLEYTDGRIGSAFRVGSGGMARIQNQPAFATDNFTIQCWARANNPGTFKHLLSKSRHPTVHPGSYGFYTGGSGGISWYVIVDEPPAGAFAAMDDPMQIWDGEWHQLTGTWDGQFLHLYIDGVLSQSTDSFGGSINYQTNFLNGDILIGDVYGTAGGFHFPGDLDEVKYYDHALTPAEVEETYSNLNTTDGLVSWWKADNDTSDSFGANHGFPIPPAGSLLSDVAVLTTAAASPVLENVVIDGGDFKATVSGPAGASFVVLRSPDLANWTPIMTNTVPFTFSDPILPSETSRFYRAIGE